MTTSSVAAEEEARSVPSTSRPPAEGLLQLLWLASPALPVGGFSYSEGLEAAVDAGVITDERSACEWLSNQLELALARADLVVVRRALQAWRTADLATLAELDAWVRATRETSELRQQTEQMGRSLHEWLKAVRPEAAARIRGPLTYPVAWALAAADCGAGEEQVLHAFAFGWAENMVNAAVRAVPLGQSAGQRILGRLAREIPGAVAGATAAPAPQTFTPRLAILSARHENQYSRLFRS